MVPGGSANPGTAAAVVPGSRRLHNALTWECRVSVKVSASVERVRELGCRVFGKVRLVLGEGGNSSARLIGESCVRQSRSHRTPRVTHLRLVRCGDALQRPGPAAPMLGHLTAQLRGG